MNACSNDSREALISTIHEQGLLGNLLRHCPDRIYFKDRQSRFLKMSDATAAFFDLASSEEAVGKTDFDYFAREHASAAFADEQQIMSTGEPVVSKEERENWPDGRITWSSSTKVAMRDEAGNIIGIMGISRDITERKAVENERDRIMDDLQEAFAQLKILSGLLPICAYCKQIRDDRGSWLEVENYIAKRSDAAFSHGICPSCLAKHCPDHG